MREKWREEGRGREEKGEGLGKGVVVQISWLRHALKRPICASPWLQHGHCLLVLVEEHHVHSTLQAVLGRGVVESTAVQQTITTTTTHNTDYIVSSYSYSRCMNKMKWANTALMSDSIRCLRALLRFALPPCE